MTHELVALAAGFVIAVVTAPVGVSGAVFLLPAQLSLLAVPNPQVTPTNLLFNVVAGPGALLRYLSRQRVDLTLAGPLVLGSGPGVVVGALLRVHVADDPTVFRLIAAAVLVPTGIFLLRRRSSGESSRRPLRPAAIAVAALVVGVVGGIYGIGGGSILGPILVGTGLSVSRVAPAALASTFVTSLIGVAAYAVIATTTPGTIAPDWSLGIAAGLGGVAGGWVGAHLQPRVPERFLRGLLGALAVGLGVLYVVQAVG